MSTDGISAVNSNIPPLPEERLNLIAEHRDTLGNLVTDADKTANATGHAAEASRVAREALGRANEQPSWSFSASFDRFFTDQVLNRAENLVMVPVSFLGCISCTVLEAGAGVLAIGSAGKWKKAVDLVEKYSFSNMLLSGPFTRLLRVLNPWASIPNTNQKITEGGGLLSPTVRIALFDSAEHLSNSPNVFARHVGSRAVYLLSAGALSVTRAVDGIAGIILGALSFVTLGKIPSVNNWAFSALQAPGVINDLFRCAIRFINPWAGETMSSRRSSEPAVEGIPLEPGRS